MYEALSCFPQHVLVTSHPVTSCCFTPLLWLCNGCGGGCLSLGVLYLMCVA